MVEDLLRGFVGEDWVEELDFSTLEKVGGSNVTVDLRDREDDLIWRVRRQEGESALLQKLLKEKRKVRFRLPSGSDGHDFPRHLDHESHDRFPPLQGAHVDFLERAFPLLANSGQIGLDLAAVDHRQTNGEVAFSHGLNKRCGLNSAQFFMRMEVSMPAAHPRTAPRTRHAVGKRATNLSLSTDVLEAAKAMDINISQVCDSYLREVVRREQERRWREEHADFITAYNATIETEGLPLDEWRSF